MTKIDSVSKRYARTLESFRKIRMKGSSISLSAFSKEHSVSYHGLRKWMGKQGIKVLAIKRLPQQEILPVKGSVRTKDTFISFSVVASPDNSNTTSDNDSVILSGVSLTFPEGTILSIRKASPEAVISLVTKYRKKMNLC